MRNFLTYMLLGLMAFGALMHSAEAARFGGGRSFGVQRSHSSLYSQRNARPTQTYNKTRSNTKKWGGLFGGLLIGGLLASLFMGHGLGAGILSWLLVGAVLFLVINFFRKRFAPSIQTPGSPSFQSNINQNSPFYGSASAGLVGDEMSNFDGEDFLRNAKVTFIRLQAAFDQKNQNDLRQFTAPDVYAEIQMQFEERGNTSNHTEVTNLNAELLDVSKQAYGTIASVLFTGTIKENDVPSQLDEIWHFRQLNPQEPWIVVGIQQESIEPH